MGRRRFGEMVCLSLAANAAACRRGPQWKVPSAPGGAPVDEAQQGDPVMSVENLVIDGALIRLEQEAGALGPKKDKMRVALRMLAVAESYVGSSRRRTPEQVALFLKLFGLDLRYPDNNQYVPFCAAGVGFSACQAYCEHDPPISFKRQDPNSVFRDVMPSIREYYFRPSASCALMVSDAQNRKIWVGKSKVDPAAVRPGWLVFFDWSRDGRPHHVGIVRSGERGLIHTVEFNTSGMVGGNQENGGAVCLRDREMNGVLGVIQTY